MGAGRRACTTPSTARITTTHPRSGSRPYARSCTWGYTTTCCSSWRARRASTSGGPASTRTSPRACRATSATSTSGTGRAPAQQVQLLAGPPAHAEVRGALQRCREPTRRRGAPALRRAPGGAEADVEVRVRAVNVNWGDSVELLGACGPLREYAWLVEEVRLRCTVEPDADFELVVDCAFAAMPKIRDKAVPDGAAGGYEAGCPKTPPMHAPPPPFAETAICIPRSLRKRPSCLIFPARKTRGRTGGPPTCANEGCLIAHTGKRASDFKHKGRFRSERGV